MAAYCSTCRRGSWACACRLPFAEKVRTLTIHPDATPSKQTGVYDGRESLGPFGSEAREQLMEETEGLGAAYTRGGRVWHKDRKSREWEALSDRQVDRVYLGGKTEQDGSYEAGPL